MKFRTRCLKFFSGRYRRRTNKSGSYCRFRSILQKPQFRPSRGPARAISDKKANASCGGRCVLVDMTSSCSIFPSGLRTRPIQPTCCCQALARCRVPSPTPRTCLAKMVNDPGTGPRTPSGFRHGPRRSVPSAALAKTGSNKSHGSPWPSNRCASLGPP